MTPTCLFCGTLALAEERCPSCGGNVYDRDNPEDRRLIRDYVAYLDSSKANTPRAMYIPIVGGLFGIPIAIYRAFMRAREVRRKYPHIPVKPGSDKPPYR